MKGNGVGRIRCSNSIMLMQKKKYLVILIVYFAMASVLAYFSSKPVMPISQKS